MSLTIQPYKRQWVQSLWQGGKWLQRAPYIWLAHRTWLLIRIDLVQSDSIVCSDRQICIQLASQLSSITPFLCRLEQVEVWHRYDTLLCIIFQEDYLGTLV